MNVGKLSIYIKAISVLLAWYSIYAHPETNGSVTNKRTVPLQPLWEWPMDDFCIFQGGANSCPVGFELQQVRISVMQSFMTWQTDEDGIPLVKLGSIGASSLSVDEYDRLYSLDLRICCRKLETDNENEKD